MEYKQGKENVVANALSRRLGEEIGTLGSTSESPTPVVLASAISPTSKGTLCIISFPTPT